MGAMGILDDAIREHLELKRSHGAPEEELRRQEVEALGIAHDEAIREDEDVDAARAAGEEHDPALEEGPVPMDLDPDAVTAEEPVFEPEAEVEIPAPEAHEPPPPADLPPAAFEAEPLEEVEPAPRRQSDTPTEGFDALAAAHEDADPFADEPAPPPAEDAEADPADPDLLEDTPDFLEETPEHDRLWFEQRPPRDFDFD